MKESNGQKIFRVYKERYAILFTVVILNISNAALWITYSPVASTVANYYQVAPTTINWFSLAYIIMSLPFAFLSTFIVNKLGLLTAIHLGSVLNCVGAVVKAFGTSGAINDSSAQFGISITGQVVSAMAQSFLLFIPTKVSQLWFPEDQRAVSTTILAMSNPLGIVIAQAATPFIVQEEDDVPLNNYIWGGLAVFAQIVTLLFVRRGKPKTPPSASAQAGELERASYLSQLKSIFTSLPYILLLMSVGVGIGLFTTISTLTQQLLCPLGYSDAFGGAANVALIFMGFAGSAVTGIMADKTRKFAEIAKMSFAAAIFFSIFMFEFYLLPNCQIAILVFCGLFGFFGVGAYPVGLELAVEVTYPVEEMISTAFIFLSGQIHSVVAIALIPAIAGTQDPDMAYLNKCGSLVDTEPKDYKLPIMIVMCYGVISVCAMIIFLNSKYKRQEADAMKINLIEDQDNEAAQIIGSLSESADYINSVKEGETNEAAAQIIDSLSGSVKEEETDDAALSEKEEDIYRIQRII